MGILSMNVTYFYMYIIVGIHIGNALSYVLCN